ncbi:MAG TPA: MmcQ/YjbR family DNA-binding protein [Candidatus Acidoferrales bacterium]|nr:MmcQ/YjbR family DNA-binding protein [Candidatus Acidoferrales bacterium]
MTPQAFHQIALRLPESIESSHMNHPDFRVRGKIFATLGYRNKN